MAVVGGIFVAAAFKVSGGSSIAFGVTGIIWWVESLVESIIVLDDHARMMHEEANRKAFDRLKPPPEYKPVPIFQTTTKLLYLKLPVDPSKLRTIAASPEPFSENELVTKRHILSSREFRTLQDEMKRRGLLEQRNPLDVRQGYKLSGVGRALMRRIAHGELKPEPLPLPLLTS